MTSADAIRKPHSRATAHVAFGLRGGGPARGAGSAPKSSGAPSGGRAYGGSALVDDLSGWPPGPEAVDAKHALVAGWMAIRADVPLAGREEAPFGIDTTGGQLVASRREVFDLHTAVTRDRVADRRELPGFADVDDEAR